MRALLALAVAVLFVACSSSDDSPSDAGPPRDDSGIKDATTDMERPDTGTDAALDAGDDADAAPGCTRTLLVGGVDVGPQGWKIVSMENAELSYAGDATVLKTSTTPGAVSGGQLLLSYANAFEAGKPFRFQVEMLVESVNVHNKYDSAAAILGSLNGMVGSENDRQQMLFLDPTKIGWSDDSQTFAMAVTDNNFHKYELSVDASNVAHVSVDGVATPLTRTNFVTNGTIAIGDQTNDRDEDAVTRIRSVALLCP